MITVCIYGNVYRPLFFMHHHNWQCMSSMSFMEVNPRIHIGSYNSSWLELWEYFPVSAPSFLRWHMPPPQSCMVSHWAILLSIMYVVMNSFFLVGLHQLICDILTMIQNTKSYWEQYGSQIFIHVFFGEDIIFFAVEWGGEILEKTCLWHGNKLHLWLQDVSNKTTATTGIFCRLRILVKIPF